MSIEDPNVKTKVPSPVLVGTPEFEEQRAIARQNNTLLRSMRTMGLIGKEDLDPIDLKEPAMWAKELWKRSYALTDNDLEAAGRAIAAYEKLNPYGPLLCRNVDIQLYVTCLASWADQALPVIEMPDKYAAALMATDCPEDCSSVRLPWRTAVLRVPPGLIFVVDEHGVPQEVRTLFVDHRRFPTQKRKRWTYYARTRRVNYFVWNKTAEELAKGEATETNSLDGMFLLEIDTTTVDERAALLIGRFIINTCIAFEDATNVRLWGKGHKARNIRTASKPLTRIFRVGSPIQLDVRPAIRAYALASEGTAEDKQRRKMTVQSLVRGHYKLQPYGPERSLRKRIWISPYWRGPDDAPDLRRDVSLCVATGDESDHG